MLCHECRPLQTVYQYAHLTKTCDTYSVVKEEACISQVGSNNRDLESLLGAPVKNEAEYQDGPRIVNVNLMRSC